MMEIDAQMCYARDVGAVGHEAGREAWKTIVDLLFSGQVHGRMGEACGAIGVPPGAMKILFHLVPGEGLPMRDLADHMSVDASYVTGLADALEDRGLVERRPHPSDRRVKMLVLTGKGVAARKGAAELMYEPPSSFAALTATELRQLRDLLGKVAEADPAVSGGPSTTERPHAAVPGGGGPGPRRSGAQGGVDLR
jgi:DNA-binding MarR family transcriptional regulator